MRILVCGGRDFSDSILLNKTLRDFFFGPEDVLICGMARGADRMAYDWVKARDILIEEYPAEWDKHGKAAGFIRNQDMLDSGVDVVVAFPGGRGTADMVRRARKAGVEVVEID